MANRLKTQVGSFSKVLDNLSLGTAATQIVDDSLTHMVDILADMRVAAVASQSSTLTASDRTAYQDVIDEYVDEIDSIADNAVWNGTSLMTSASTMNIQSGTSSGDTTTLNFDKITSYSLSIENAAGTNLLSVSSTANADSAVDIIDDALDMINEYQAYIGAKQNVMDVQTNVANAMITSQSVAYGRIMDADMAEETAKLSAAQIQRDAATAMLTQSLSMNKDLVSFLLKSSFN
jgi:flagellin